MGSRSCQNQYLNGLHGKHFFSETEKNARLFVYEKDREQFIERINKERLLKEIEKHGSVNYFYRLLINGEPVYVNMKIKRDDRHIIIGISNVDTQMKDRMAAAHAAEERKSYQRLSALNGNLIVLYYVDVESGQYTEFSASKEYDDLGIAKHGSDFFGTSYENSLRTIHPEDQALFHSQVTKENVLAAGRQGRQGTVPRLPAANPALWLGLILLGLTGAAGTVLVKARKR